MCKFFMQVPLNLFVRSIYEEMKKMQAVEKSQGKGGFDTIQ